MAADPRVLFCGNRTIALKCLHALDTRLGIRPVALLVSNSAGPHYRSTIAALCTETPGTHIYTDADVADRRTETELESLDLDLIVSVHYPHILPAWLLELPRRGAVNLHPSFLPFNRGWHTPTWAMLENTPAGASLHYMTPDLDAGPIVAQEEVPVFPTDTADSLYARILSVEVDVLLEGLPLALAGEPGKPQPAVGSVHRRSDLEATGVQDLETAYGGVAVKLVDTLRALTTNDVSEAAYLNLPGGRARIQVRITEDPDPRALDRSCP